MAYLKTTIESLVAIEKLVCFYVHVFTEDFKDTGEQHDFWEMVYVESGTITILIGDTPYILATGEVLFIPPNEYHSTHITHGMVKVYRISFQSSSRSMNFFNHYKASLSPSSKHWAMQLFEEGNKSLIPHKDKNGYKTVAPAPNAPIGGQQMYKIYLEGLLINILREEAALTPDLFASKSDFYLVLCERIMEYLKENVYSDVSLNDLCQIFGYSNTLLCTRFKEHAGVSIMHYFNTLKINEACRLIRETDYSFAHISNMLSFNNPYYFSKVFKRMKGITPMEYKKAIQGTQA